MKKVYFLSDAHLGNASSDEGRLVSFLDSIKGSAKAVYMLGDMFDFWYEWRRVVPKGFVRFLGKLAVFVDSGVEWHYLIGNDDIWAGDYLERECGVILHRGPITVEIDGKRFFLAHGDGLHEPSKGFLFIRSIFHSRVCQWLFSNLLHPDVAMWFGMTWARKSREKHSGDGELPYQGEDKEPLVLFAKEHMRTVGGCEYYIFGHRHIELDLMLRRDVRMMILGDWISQFTYVEWGGSHLAECGIMNYEL